MIGVSPMFILEVHYEFPPDAPRETRLTDRAIHQGGWLKGREYTHRTGADVVRLFYEFHELDAAEEAASALRLQGEHVEGPVDSAPPSID
jgi:hypothetical protein